MSDTPTPDGAAPLPVGETPKPSDPQDPRGPWRTGYANNWRTKSLFIEYGQDEFTKYSIREEHKKVGGKTYPSLYRLYLELGDVTEYLFATTYLGGLEHWNYLCESEWFRPTIARWRTELELKIQAEALQRIRHEAEVDGRNAFQANRFLVAKSWVGEKPEDPKRRGRPSKAEIKEAAKEQARFASKPEDDLRRLQELLN